MKQIFAQKFYKHQSLKGTDSKAAVAGEQTKISLFKLLLKKGGFYYLFVKF